MSKDIVGHTQAGPDRSISKSVFTIIVALVFFLLVPQFVVNGLGLIIVSLFYSPWVKFYGQWAIQGFLIVYGGLALITVFAFLVLKEPRR